MTRLLATLCLPVIFVGCDRSRDSTFLPTGPTPPGPVVSQPPAPPGPPAPPPNYGQEPIIGTGVAIAAGNVVQGQVETVDPVCFPFWDLSGQCRQYDLVAPGGGTLDVRLTWSDPSSAHQMTVFVVDASRGWLSSDGPGTPMVGTERVLSVPVVGGDIYYLLVMSYRPPQSFQMGTTHRTN